MNLRKWEPHTLAGAYAMDAISARDRARFERHMARCSECAQEIAGLREATARLGAATAMPLPPGLKERVMAAATMTRQQPPAAAGERRRAARGWRVRLVVATGTLAAVAVLGAAVVFGVSNGSMRQQLDQAQTNSQQITAVLTAGDAAMMTSDLAGGGTATIVMSHSRHALVFTAAGLRAPALSSGYELWLIGPAGDRAVGMLPQASRGMTGPVIASGLRRGDHLALTAEPSAGTSRPTAPMMLDLAL